MKRILIYFSIFVITLLTGTVLFFYIHRDSCPTVICTSLSDMIRPRDRCWMNPFRDKQPETMAEKALEELKNGNTDALLPFDANANAATVNLHQQREKEFRIKYWHIGDRIDSKDNISVTYWVAREKYKDARSGIDNLESVTFTFARESNELKPESFSAIY